MDIYQPEYRIEPRGDGHEPQMSYPIRGEILWLPLNPDGYLLEPDIWNYTSPIVTRHIEMPKVDALRAVTCAKRINQQPLIAEVEAREEKG